MSASGDAVNPARSTSQRTDDHSGDDPNCVIVVGNGPRAEILQLALETHYPTVFCHASEEFSPGAVYVEAAGDHRHEQLAALRQISAQAPDEAIIISTSPILSQSEIAGSVTHPSRLIGLVPPWSNRTPLCELIQSPCTSRQALNQALEFARHAGWIPLIQQEGGPSALTRLFGSIIVGGWNLALRTGRPDEVDDAARQWGLAWSPLREIDRVGLARLAAVFDRSGQAADIDSIYFSLGGTAPSAAFRAKCGNDLIEADVAIGYFLKGAEEAAWSLVADGLATDKHELRRLLAAAFGRRVARQVSQAVSARYPEMTTRSPTTAPA